MVITVSVGLVMIYMSEYERRLWDLSLILRYGKDISLGHLMRLTEINSMAMRGILGISFSYPGDQETVINLGRHVMPLIHQDI